MLLPIAQNAPGEPDDLASDSGASDHWFVVGAKAREPSFWARACSGGPRTGARRPPWMAH